MADDDDGTVQIRGFTVDEESGEIESGNTISISSIVDRAVDAVVEQLFRPLFKGLYIIPLALVGLVAWIFLGGDRALKETVEGFPGLADIPVLLATWLVAALEPIGSGILTTISAANLSMVTAIADQSSILTMPLLFTLQAIELGLLLYGIWAGIRLFEAVPVVGEPLVAIGDIATKPFRAIAGRIR